MRMGSHKVRHLPQLLGRLASRQGYGDVAEEVLPSDCAPFSGNGMASQQCGLRALGPTDSLDDCGDNVFRYMDHVRFTKCRVENVVLYS